MDETASQRNCTLVEDLVQGIVTEGFNHQRYEQFQELFGRPPTMYEVLSPACVIENIRTEDNGSGGNLRLDAITEMHQAVAERISSRPLFYLENCPPDILLCSTQQHKKSKLREIVACSLRERAGKQTKDDEDKEYTPHQVKTASPARYQRLEQNRKVELPAVNKEKERMYITSIEWNSLDYFTARKLFHKLYQLIPDTSLEVHNNQTNFHQTVPTLEEALSSVTNRNIAKIDQPLESTAVPKVNVYLKPNSAYHIRIDIFGTEKEIMDFSGKIELVLEGILAKN